MADKTDNSKPVVLILKEKNIDDSYERLLNEHGYRSVFIPVLSFKFINQEELKDRLQNPDKHDGLIFTSQRAVEAVQLCVTDPEFKEKWDSCLKEKWLALPIFVTGKGTGKQAREKLQLCRIFGEDSGNAEALASVIFNTLPENSNRDLLFPSANIKKETLPNMMKEKGYNVHCVTAYCTQAHPNIYETIKSSFSPETDAKIYSPPSCVVFFSPSGVIFSHDALQRTLKNLDVIKCVGIGQSTAQELRKQGLVVSGVPEKPHAQSLLKTLDSILR